MASMTKIPQRPDEEKIKKVEKKSNNNVFDLTTSDEEDVVQTSVVTSSYRQEVFSKFFNNAKEIEHDIEGFHKQYPQATSGLLTILKKAVFSTFSSNNNNITNNNVTLLQSKASTPSNSNMMMSTSSNSNSTSQNDNGIPPAENASCVVPQISCVRPRGKHDVEFHKNAIVFRAKKIEKSISIPLENIEFVFILKRFEKYQKQQVTSFVVRMKDDCEIPYGKQIFDEIVMTLKTKEGKPDCVDIAIKDLSKLPATKFSATAKPLPNAFSEMTREDILSKLFKYFTSKTNLIESSRQIFSSADGDTSVKCIVGVENGHLYPLSNGVYFLNKPYIFLPFDDMVGLEQGRAGSGRTTDFIITMDDGDVHQFGMISTDESDYLGAYMQYVKNKISKKRNADNNNNNNDASDDNNQKKQSKNDMDEEDATEDDEEEEGDGDDDDDDDFDLEEAKNNESDSESESEDEDDDDESDMDEDDDEGEKEEEEEEENTKSTSQSKKTQEVIVLDTNVVEIIDDSADDEEEEEEKEDDDEEVLVLEEPPAKKQKTTNNTSTSDGAAGTTKQKQKSISSFFVKRS